MYSEMLRTDSSHTRRPSARPLTLASPEPKHLVLLLLDSPSQIRQAKSSKVILYCAEVNKECSKALDVVA